VERLPWLGCHADGQRGEVSLIGRAPVKARVRSAAVVEVEIAANRFAGLGHAVVDAEIHLLVFDAAPQPLDEDVVSPRTFAVNADRDAVLDQPAGERGARDCEPWSVSKFSGLPCSSASSNVSTQNAASMVIDTRHDRTRRLNQSSTTVR
jgi:hypothetical protein